MRSRRLSGRHAWGDVHCVYRSVAQTRGAKLCANPFLEPRARIVMLRHDSAFAAVEPVWLEALFAVALIECTECHNRVSDRASACPTCGCPVVARPTIATASQFSTPAASGTGMLRSNASDYVPPPTSTPRAKSSRSWISSLAAIGIVAWQLSPQGPLARAVHLPWASGVANSVATASSGGTGAPLPSYQGTWNTSDMDATTNGNVRVAADLIARNGISRSAATAVSTADVAKAPFRYIGNVYEFRGSVGIVQEYAPNSDIGRAVGNGKVVAEVVALDSRLSTATPMDIIVLGDTGTIHEGDSVVVDGYVAGQVQVDNKLGGKTTQLVIVAASVQRGGNY
jgi:hypothetical protein